MGGFGDPLGVSLDPCGACGDTVAEVGDPKPLPGEEKHERPGNPELAHVAVDDQPVYTGQAAEELTLVRPLEEITDHGATPRAAFKADGVRLDRGPDTCHAAVLHASVALWFGCGRRPR
jgi:hypothetical protein